MLLEIMNMCISCFEDTSYTRVNLEKQPHTTLESVFALFLRAYNAALNHYMHGSPDNTTQFHYTQSYPEGAGALGVGTRTARILVMQPNVFLAKWSSKIPERSTAPEKPWAQPQIARFNCLRKVTDSGTARKAEGGHTNIQRLCPALRATALEYHVAISIFPLA